jgi:hypothetical protein
MFCTRLEYIFVNDKLVISCKAFPKGIPDDIYFEKYDHRKPHKNDNGILFNLDKDKEQIFKEWEKL